MKKVAVFRLQLFKPSEPFIGQQVNQLQFFSPIFYGRKQFGAPPESAVYRTFGPGRLANASYVCFGRPDRLARAMAADDISLIHAHFAVDALYAASAAYRCRLPLVATLHGFDVTTHRAALFRTLRPALVRYSLLRERIQDKADAFLCVSQFIKRRAIEVGFPPEKLHTHYTGLDVQAFSITDQERANVILHVGRLVEVKGTAYLLGAFEKISRKHPSTVLTIIGDGPERARLVQLACDLGISERVRFLGLCSNEVVKAQLATAAALVLPSIHAHDGSVEGLGMVLLEAAASGVPTVGSSVGGIPEAIVDGVSGYLVRERDSEHIAEKLDLLLSDMNLRAQMGVAGRQLVASNFDIKHQTEKLESFYARLL